MIRRSAFAGVCVAVSMSVGSWWEFHPGSPRARLPALPTATGKAICKIASGSGTVSPGLTVGGSAGGVKINFSATMVVGGSCGGAVTSPSGVTVLGGTLTGSGYYNPVPSTGNGSSCANFASSDIVGKIKVKINWSVTGPAIAADEGGLQEQHRHCRGIRLRHHHPRCSDRNRGQVGVIHRSGHTSPARSRDHTSGAGMWFWLLLDLLHSSR